MSGSIGQPPIPLYVSYASQETTYAAASVKADAQSGALITYFQHNAATITTPAALLKDYRALSVVLGAFGLKGAINNTGILQKLLTQDPTAKTSLAQTLGNAKYLAFAKALSTWDPPPFSTAAGRSKIVGDYTLNTFEAKADTQSSGLSNALYFTRNAASVTTLTQLQSDPTLLAVVVTAAGLPLQDFQLLSFDQQTSILKSKVNVASLQDPATVKRIAEQYLLLQPASTDSGPANGSLASLYADTTADTGDSLLSILNPDSGIGGDSASNNTLSLFA